MRESCYCPIRSCIFDKVMWGIEEVFSVLGKRLFPEDKLVLGSRPAELSFVNCVRA
jgi:hypothetical protein